MFEIVNELKSKESAKTLVSMASNFKVVGANSFLVIVTSSRKTPATIHSSFNASGH